MEIKNDRLYSESHEWVLFENDSTALLGVTDYAQSELGDLVFVNLPQVGDTVTVGTPFADVESVKAVSDVYCPVTGTVAAINEELLTTPERINQSAYDAWFIRVTDITAKGALMDAQAYRALTEK